MTACRPWAPGVPSVDPHVPSVDPLRAAYDPQGPNSLILYILFLLSLNRESIWEVRCHRIELQNPSGRK